MPVFETFSRRMRRERGEEPKVFQTEEMPLELQAHLERILHNLAGREEPENWLLSGVGYVIRNEYPHYFTRNTPDYSIPHKILRRYETEQYPDELKLDVIEMAFQARSRCRLSGENLLAPPAGVTGKYLKVNAAIEHEVEDLNTRFRQNGYGYQLENNLLIPIDSTFTHDQAVKPALYLIQEVGFDTALDTFYGAFDAYKRGEMRNAIKSCGDTLDTTMKTIFAELGWERPGSETFMPYVRKAIENGLLPTSLHAHYDQLASLITSGPGNLRNTKGGHGPGPNEAEPPEFFVHYMINMTASTILFLVQAYRQYKGAGESPAAAP